MPWLRHVFGTRHPGTIPPWSAARDPHECSREVWVVCKAGVLRDGRNSFLPTCELRTCPCDTSPSDVLPHRAAESAPEEFGQVHWMNPGDACDVRKSVGFHQVRVEIGYAPVEAMVWLK